MTVEEIVKETIEYYKTHKRAVNAYGYCYYITKEGDMCAAGRCQIMPDESMLGSVIHIPNFERTLKEQYRGHSVRFWRELQGLHDRSKHWVENDKGGSDLTHEGRLFAESIMNDFS